MKGASVCRFRGHALLVMTALLAALLQPAPAVSVTTVPDAELFIKAQAYEGARGTIYADLRLRCAPGFVFADLVLDFSQGGVVTPSLFGRSFPCDGNWHLQRVQSSEAFDPGRAMLTARLSVTDLQTGDPGRQAVVTQSIYVRPAAKIELAATAVLRPHHVVRLTLKVRCDAPWIGQGLYVEAVQGNAVPFAQDNESFPDVPLTCDGVLRSHAFWFKSNTARPFTRGRMTLSASLSLLDPEFFDPVSSATANRSVTVL